MLHGICGRVEYIIIKPMKRFLVSGLLLLASPASAIEIIKCSDPVFRTKVGITISYPPISRRSCICTDKGTFCQEGGSPILDTNVYANCFELDGEYTGNTCVIRSDDGKGVVLFTKERGVKNGKIK